MHHFVGGGGDSLPKRFLMRSTLRICIFVREIFNFPQELKKVKQASEIDKIADLFIWKDL